MTAIQLLKRDHTTVKRLFTEFNRTPARAVKKRRELIQRIGTDLDVHARIEEEIFYPAMAEREEAREFVSEAREEHAQVTELVAEVRGMDPEDRGAQAELVARMKELRQAVVRHASEEEHEMFPLAEHLGEELMSGKRAGRRAA